MKFIKLVVALAAMVVMGTSQAALFDRGGGLIYDDVLNVTWLQDANYAKTSGYVAANVHEVFGVPEQSQNIYASGRMGWDAAQTWASNLVYGGFSDWRLPTVGPVGSDWNYEYSTSGNTDHGYNIKSPNSELSYMFHVNLGLKGYYTESGEREPNFGIYGNGGTGGCADVGAVKNFCSNDYWSGSVLSFTNDFVWVLDTAYGAQTNSGKISGGIAWAVRDGDVVPTSPVPAPPAFLLMLTGLGLLGLTKRFRKNV